MGRRIAKTIPVSGQDDSLTEYCYAGDRIIAHYAQGAALVKKFIYGPCSGSRNIQDWAYGSLKILDAE
jgi:hypothetical protein